MNPLIPITVLGGILLYFFAPKSARADVVNLGDTVRRVTYDGRNYLVTKLSNGAYNVTSLDTPNLAITFDQTGPKERKGDTSLLEADMQKFPANLFG